MGRKKDVEKLANIIKNFRKGELDIKLDERHVEKWLSQFSEESQDVILKETTRIFSELYFSKDDIKKGFLDKVIDDLMQKYSFQSIDDLCENVVFVSVQEFGQSQRMLVDMLEKQVQKKYGFSIQGEVTNTPQTIVYLDDGLYTGSTAKKELISLIERLPANCRIDVFFMIAHSSSLWYVKKVVLPEAKKKNISVEIFPRVYLETNKHIPRYDYEHSRSNHQEHLWPSSSLRSIPVFAQYGDCVEEALRSINSPAINYVYRKGIWNDDEGIFSSVKNRNIVEQEFFLKGLKIYQSMSDPKGKYPLGYNTYASFGFGSFCASDLNIPNTCPLVLWWGNVRKCEDALDNWYPLLPRRTNPKADGIEPCAW